MLTVGNDAQFNRFAAALGHPEWLGDQRFATGVERIRNRDSLIPLIEAVFLQRTASEWIEILLEADIPVGPIHDFSQVFSDPQVVHRGLRQEVPHHSGIPVPLVANPIRFTERPIVRGAAPPRLGEHTDAVLKEDLGLGEQELARLRAQGVI